MMTWLNCHGIIKNIVRQNIAKLYKNQIFILNKNKFLSQAIVGILTCRDFDLLGFCTCWDFVPVGIITCWDFGVGILTCRDYDCWDYEPLPSFSLLNSPNLLKIVETVMGIPIGNEFY
jgi:hypothetical protein